MKNLLVIIATKQALLSDFTKHLFQNISKELFDLYLTADGKYFSKELFDSYLTTADYEHLDLDLDLNNCHGSYRKLRFEIQNAIEIINPTDDRLKNLDGIITIGVIM